VPVITNASRDLEEQDAIVGLAREALAAAGLDAQPLDVVTGSTSVLEDAEAIVLTGGDPFRLLADLRTSGADARLAAAQGRGAAIAGQSAGAIVLGPDLAPVTLTSPFAPSAGLDLTGLALTRRLVLPHHGRPGRNAVHRQAALRFAQEIELIALWDDEALLIDAAGWQIRRGDLLTRPARLDDAGAIAGIFHHAALAAWSDFLPRTRLASADPDEPAWWSRIRTGGDGFLVAEDGDGPVAFVHIKPTSDPAVGELDLLYTHPRAAGRGIGRRLLERATWMLLCRGCREAVLWTEARNARALTMYRANGWQADGGEDRRDYLGTPIRNLRHRLNLVEHAGGR
jgi:dipeptidase E